MILARLFGSDFRYVRHALKVQGDIRLGRPARAARVARKLAAAAPSLVHRTAAADLLEAIEVGDLERAASTATHTWQFIGRRETNKIVSRSCRFFWLGNTKVASMSITRALRDADPEAKTFRSTNVDDILWLHPEVRDYFSFAFVRHPFHRSLSLFADKFLGAKNRRSEKHVAFWKSRLGRYRGLSMEMDFESFCAWLNSPYGADAFADSHWRSQHLLITMSGRMPDFVGRFETMEEDFRTVARRIGRPDLLLRLFNTGAGWPGLRKGAWEEVKAVRRAVETTHLTDRARELLRRRYADDFRILGYDPE